MNIMTIIKNAEAFTADEVHEARCYLLRVGKMDDIFHPVDSPAFARARRVATAHRALTEREKVIAGLDDPFVLLLES